MSAASPPAGRRQTRTWVRKHEEGGGIAVQMMPRRCSLVNSGNERRARAMLRYDPEVEKMLDLWWQTAKRSIKTSRKSIVPSQQMYSLTQQEEPPAMERKEYIVVLCKMQKALYEHYDKAEAIEAAENDWRHDVRGGTTLEETKFKDGIFELADVWTADVSAEVYAAFLGDLFHHIANGAPPNSYFWKEDHEIDWGGYQTGQFVMPSAPASPRPALMTPRMPKQEPLSPRVALGPGPKPPLLLNKAPIGILVVPRKDDVGIQAWKRMVGAGSPRASTLAGPRGESVAARAARTWVRDREGRMRVA